jgi:hypothetical protein
MSSHRIETLWINYRIMVLPAFVPEVQLIECRRAFYAGAASLFGSIMNSLSPGDDANEQDIQIMEDVQREFEAFGKELDHHMLGQSGKPS